MNIKNKIKEYLNESFTENWIKKQSKEFLEKYR
jgi:hypothetical protein